jgi:hypothetical protein
MQDGAFRYPVEDGVSLVEMRLDSISQLFNSLDPAPFRDKDLDRDAEEYIVGAVDDFTLSAPLKIVVYLPVSKQGADTALLLGDAIHRYFGYALSMERRKLRFVLREGRISFLIGIAFLVACFSLREVVQTLEPGTFREIAAEGLLISGWVAMWRPLQIFLYGWWPGRHLCRIYSKIESLPVEVRTTTTSQAPASGPA